MKNLKRKSMAGLSFFVAFLAFIVAESFLYPLWLDSENLLKILVYQPGTYSSDIVDRLSSYVFLGGLVVSGLIAMAVYLLLVTRSRAMLSSNMAKSQEWLEELYEEAPIPYVLMVPNGTLMSPNKAALRLFGCSADVLALLTLKDVVMEDDRDDLKNLLYHFKRNRPVYNEVVRIESKNEEVRSVLLSIFPGGKFGSASGKALVTMVDISEQKRLENELRAQVSETQKFAKAAESSTDGVVITDNDGRIVYINAAWMQFTGYAKEEVMGQHLQMLRGGSTLSTVLSKLEEAVQTRISFKSEEMIYTRKDGRVYHAEIEMIPIIDEQSGAAQFYVYIERDISKRKEVDRAKSEFVSLAAHQLKTPLLTMQWYAEMMLSGDTGVLAEKQRAYVLKMSNSTHNLVDLVSLFLDVSKIEMGTLQVQPAALLAVTVIESVLEELQPHREKKMLHLKKNIVLNTEMTTDAKWLRVVIQNLLTNAVKYTPEKGMIGIDARESGGNMVFTVQDSGCGIPTEEQHLIFSKMFRAHNATKASTQGFGLGLYMTKSIVESLGGNISFVSVLNQGTTFTVSLPLMFATKRSQT